MSMPSSIAFPLANESRFGVIHHRKLNARNTLDAVLPVVAQLPTYLHIAEGDLCWAKLDGRYVHYFYHPDLIVDTKRPDELRRSIRDGTLWTLEHALDAAYDSLLFVIELKTGDGDRNEAIRSALALLESRRPGRYWIDTFRLSDLQRVKAFYPTVATSLHTKFVSKSLVLKTAFAPLPLSLHTIRSLTAVDLCTLTYRTSTQRHLPWCNSRDTVAALAAHGKQLIYGGVATPALFHDIRDSGVKAGYIKFDWRDLLA